MSMTWPWSSPACATSGTEEKKKALGHRGRISSSFALLAFLLFFCAILPAEADVIQAGRDVQSAIDSAQQGDVLLVTAGESNSFVVDRPLTIEG